MKTLDALYQEIMASQELKQELVKAAKAGNLKDFFQAQGCPATAEEVDAFLKAKQTSGELADEELDNVAGGGCGWLFNFDPTHTTSASPSNVTSELENTQEGPCGSVVKKDNHGNFSVSKRWEWGDK